MDKIKYFNISFTRMRVTRKYDALSPAHTNGEILYILIRVTILLYHGYIQAHQKNAIVLRNGMRMI